MVTHVCCQWHVFPATRLGACSGEGGSVRVYNAKFTDNSCHLCSATAWCSFKSLLPPSLCPVAFMLLACGEFNSGCRLRGGTCRLRYQLRLCLYVCDQAFSTFCNIALPLLSACLQFFVCAYLPHWSYIQLVGTELPVRLQSSCTYLLLLVAFR